MSRPEPAPAASYSADWKSTFHVRGVGQPGMYASDNGGHLILVVPGERLVVVITASNYNRASRPSMIFFRDTILPTIHGAPRNDERLATLRVRAHQGRDRRVGARERVAVVTGPRA